MSSRRIQRYLLAETAVPMAMGLVVFTFVLLMGRLLRLVELIITKGVPLAEIARLFLSLMPTFLVLTIPLAFLLGVMLGFGRLSADREILALKASGVSLYQITRPVVLLSLPACLLTAGMSLYLRPASEGFFRQQLFDIAASRASVALQAQVFNDDFPGLVLYANRIDEQTGTLREVFISDERHPKTPTIIVADSGRLVSDRSAQNLFLQLERGTMHRQPRGDEGETVFENYQVLNFRSHDIQIDMEEPSRTGQRRIRNKELAMDELHSAIADAAPEDRQELLAELHTRMALPLAPLLFALLGVPLGIQPHRSGRGGNFAIALGVFLCYYLALSFGQTLVADAGWPALTLWLPNGLFLLAGCYLLHRAAIERPLLLLSTPLNALGRAVRRLLRPGDRS